MKFKTLHIIPFNVGKGHVHANYIYCEYRMRISMVISKGNFNGNFKVYKCPTSYKR